MSLVKVGVSAWTEKTLVDSGWYPRGARSAATRLRYYASQFPLAEVDATYYALPTRRQADAWVERTPDDFTFNVNLRRAQRPARRGSSSPCTSAATTSMGRSPSTRCTRG